MSKQRLFSYAKRAVLVLLIIMVAFLTVQPTQTARAQTVGSAVTSGFVSGLAGCAAQVGGSILASTLGGALSSLLNVTSVPVSDGGAVTLKAATDGCLDGIAYSVAKSLLNRLADSTLTWVQSGFTEFGQGGNRAYVGDLQGFAANVGEQTFNTFTDDYVTVPPRELCGSYGKEALTSIATRYYQENPLPTGVQPGAAIEKLSGELDSVAEGDCEGFKAVLGDEPAGEYGTGQETMDAFLGGDFAAGGWEALAFSVDNPNANPIGAYLQQNRKLKNRVQQEQELDLKELQQNNGWLSAVACPKGGMSSTTGKCADGNEPIIETPGTAVNQAVNDLIGSDFRRLELADEVNEIVGELANQLVANLTGEGSEGFFDPGLADATDPLGNLDSYADGGYQGGFRANYAASTLEDQIELESNILAYINGGDIVRDGEVQDPIPTPGLPTTNELARLKARANQCLASDAFAGPGEQNAFQSLLTQLDSFEQSVYPPPGNQTRQSQLGAGSESSGPQKVNWVGNALNWEPGVVYGVKNCSEFSNAYKLSYVPESSSGTWRVFMCKTEDSGDFNETSSVFNGSFEEISESSVANLFADNPPLYSVKGSRKVEIDWTEADFEWDYYDRFAGEFVRSVHDAITNLQPLIVNGSLASYNIPGARPSKLKEELEKIDQILSGVSSDDVNRYGLQTCNDGTINVDSLSYVVKPGENVWTHQECIKVNEDIYRFKNTGATTPAFRTVETASASFAEYAARINRLIGDTNYDSKTVTADFSADGVSNSETREIDVYQAPATGDSLRELLHDVASISENIIVNAAAVGELSLAGRQEALDRRFGRLESRFESDEDLGATLDGFNALNPNDPNSLYSQVLRVVNENSCNLPADYEDPVGDDGSGSGEGEDGGDESSGPQISSFTASRRPSSRFISVSWQASATSCKAESNPVISGWSGPVGPSGNQLITSSNSVRLTLVCERDGEEVAASRFVNQAGSGGDERFDPRR
jgi:hypothetical protein